MLVVSEVTEREREREREREKEGEMAVGAFRMSATRARRVGGNAVCSSSSNAARRRSGVRVVTPVKNSGAGATPGKRAAVVPAAKSGLDIDTDEIVNSIKEKVCEDERLCV